MKNWPVPRTVSEIRRFLGFANFFRRFIKNYSDVARPLEKLTGSHTRFTWSPSCQMAFDRLKGLLLSAPVLKLTNASKPFRVITDASDCAVGGVLLQEEEAGQWHPVAYTSRRLSAAEMNYHPMERETLAVVHALRVWKLYLYNSFEVLTDNMGSRTSNPRKIYPDVKLGGWGFCLSLISRSSIALVLTTWRTPWPAMRVISLGIRTVPVLSVAKKLAVPRPTPTAPAAKCGLIRQDEAD